jgi:hypothetical protein
MAPPPEGFERRIPYPEKFFNTLSGPFFPDVRMGG